MACGHHDCALRLLLEASLRRINMAVLITHQSNRYAHTIHDFFQASTYFLPTAAKNKHKFIWNKFEHPQDEINRGRGEKANFFELTPQ